MGHTLNTYTDTNREGERVRVRQKTETETERGRNREAWRASNISAVELETGDSSDLVPCQPR